jgi:uncharacterized protein
MQRMASLCDVNFLLALCYRRHTAHRLALDWLELMDVGETLIICRFSQLALLRLLNNPAVMHGAPRGASQAWRDYDAVIADERFSFRGEPNQLEITLRTLTHDQQVAPKRWSDAYLAAFAIADELRFVTFDTGFKQYMGLDLVLLA